jgi:hypothetical protein
MLAWDRAHPAAEIDPLVAGWREEHPDGTLEDLVRDLELWIKPADEDAQRLAWYSLKRLKDPAAMEGFHIMRAAATIRPRGRDEPPRLPWCIKRLPSMGKEEPVDPEAAKLVTLAKASREHGDDAINAVADEIRRDDSGA